MNSLSVKTPNYVLLRDNVKIGPELTLKHSSRKHLAIYGFSDKEPYDLFCASLELEVTPYPLVKGYLRNQIEEAGDSVLLVVIDAQGPNQPTLHAATMQDVLTAQQNQSSHVQTSYQLTRNETSTGYMVEEKPPVAELAQ